MRRAEDFKRSVRSKIAFQLTDAELKSAETRRRLQEKKSAFEDNIPTNRRGAHLPKEVRVRDDEREGHLHIMKTVFQQKRGRDYPMKVVS